MSIKVVWESHGRRVFKDKKLNGKIKYHIWNSVTNKEVTLWERAMLNMCKVVIKDAEESESEE